MAAGCREAAVSVIINGIIFIEEVQVLLQELNAAIVGSYLIS